MCVCGDQYNYKLSLIQKLEFGELWWGTVPIF